MKQFAKETGDSEELTELDFILMAIMYDIEKRRVGVNHINRTPLLDVLKHIVFSPSEAATLRTQANCERSESTFAPSPVSTIPFREAALEEMPVSTGTYPCGLKWTLPLWNPGDIDHRPIPPYKERTLRATAPAFVYSGGVVSYPQNDDHSSDEKYIRKDSSNTTRRERETIHHNEEVNVNTALPPLQKHQGSSHVYGGSGSLVVKGEEEDCADDWVDASSLSSFSKNVPVESNRPVKDHVVCCTGNPAVQVGRSMAA